jgi:cholesterol transport system auxiliary component
VLALGRVERSDDLNEQILYRRSPVEVGYYDARRWTETPDNYLRRVLDRSLFQLGACRQSSSPSAPTLEATLIRFEQQLSPPEARIAVHVRLEDGAGVALDTTIEVTHAVAGESDEFDDFVRTMQSALQDAVGAVVAQVRGALEDRTRAAASERR